MPQPVPDELAVIEPSGALKDALEATALRLRRAWPRSPDHLLLEFATPNGRIVPGQWFRDRKKLHQVVRQTQKLCPQCLCGVVEAKGTAIIIQMDGADRKLPALKDIAASPNATLLTHRPERRAVVRESAEQSVRYIKVLRPQVAAWAAIRARHAMTLGRDSFETPAVLSMDEAEGVIVFVALEGTSLFDLSGSPESPAIARGAGRALAGLHEAPGQEFLEAHTASAEIEVLKKWLGHLGSFFPDRTQEVTPHGQRVFDALLAGSSPTQLIHRDFYDKQIMALPNGAIGIIDFDTLATGEPALDVANMICHLELRALQRRCPRDTARACVTAFLDGYDLPTATRQRLPAYLDATRLRLACVYSFRPRWQSVVDALLASVGG